MNNIIEKLSQLLTELEKITSQTEEELEKMLRPTYYQRHKATILEKAKNRYNENKEVILEGVKKYAKKNKEKIKKYQANYYLNNKEKFRKKK